MRTFHFVIPGVAPFDVQAFELEDAEGEALYLLGLTELPEGTTISEEI
jgi:hypothetical protein